jgi:hypothetical protein
MSNGNEDVNAADRRFDTAAVLAYLVTILVALSMLTPYVWTIPKDNINLITQGQTTLWNGWMLVLGYFFKTRINNPVDAETISNQAKTIKEAQTALGVAAGATPGKVSLEPGDKVEVKAEEAK